MSLNSVYTYLSELSINTGIYNTLYFFLEVIDPLLILLPVLLSVAFMTIIERKQMAAHQRRIGPNTVGIYGILQPLILQAAFIREI